MKKKTKKPLIEALPVTRVFVDPPKPKPQNIADAWDAMQAAGELPHHRKHQTVNPFRAAQDRDDAFVPTRRPLDETDKLSFDPSRHTAPDVHQSSGPIIPALAPLHYSGCPHLMADFSSAIKWMQHSQNITTGRCAHCPTQVDTRHPEHAELLRANPRAIRNMGRAAQNQVPGTGVGQVYGSRFQLWRYQYLMWVYGIKPRLQKAWQWLRKDF